MLKEQGEGAAYIKLPNDHVVQQGRGENKDKATFEQDDKKYLYIYILYIYIYIYVCQHLSYGFTAKRKDVSTKRRCQMNAIWTP